MSCTKDLVHFRNLYDKWFNSLVIYAVGMGVPYQQAKDIVQECFIKLYESDNIISNTTAYLFVSVKNASINWMKAARKSTKFNIRFEDTDNDVPSFIYNESFEDVIEYLHKVEEAYLKLQQMGGRCKDIFIMFYLDKMKIKDIAEELELSENTVKTYLRRAKDILRITIIAALSTLFLYSCIN